MGKDTIAVKAGNVIIGKGFPVSVQSMWKKPLSLDLEAILAELQEFKSIGCDIMRFAVPHLEDADRVGLIAESSVLPIVVDIHFDYRIAMKCLDFPIAKIRINPGTIGNEEKIKEIVKKAADKNIPIRIGINAGSLPAHLEKEKDKPRAMIRAAEDELNLLEQLDFRQMVFSLKSTDVQTTIEANRIFSANHPYPLHLGVTEAGPLIHGIIKNTLAISTLLSEGIGDTIRISLSDTSFNEIITGKTLLELLGLKKTGVGIISCPMCSRSAFNVADFMKELSGHLPKINKDIVIAVMGCPVNGPGEAKSANLGITGAGKFAVIFKEGQIIKKVEVKDALEAFLKEIESL